MGITKFKMFLVGVSILVIVGFFLPWARPLPASQAPAKENVKEKIQAADPNFVMDFLLIPERDRKNLLLSEPEGISAYQMVMSSERESRTGKLTQSITQHLFAADHPDWRIKLLVLAPLLAIISLFCFLMEEVPVAVSLSFALLQVLIYGAIRWQINAGYPLHLEIALAPGLWMTLYGCIVLALGNLGMCIRK